MAGHCQSASGILARTSTRPYVKEKVPLVRRRDDIAGGMMLFPLAVMPQQVEQPKSSVQLFNVTYKHNMKKVLPICYMP